MSAIAVVCVLGVIGALASTLRYDQLYGHSANRVQLPPRSVRPPRFRRRSRQLRAVEAALASEVSEPAPASSAPASSAPVQHGRWSRR